MMSISLRRATMDDAAAIAEVRIKSWRATYRGMIPDAYLDDMKLEDSTAHWAKILEVASERVCVFVAESEGEIVGFASGMLLKETKLGLDAELTAVYLSPSLQRAGIGRRMVQEVAKACRAQGATGLLVWVISGNKPARKFYESLGAELLIEQGFNWDGMDLQEAGYGWKDLGMLLSEAPEMAAARRNLH
ncbi:MAG: GNAT family N-acetyltransferase [Pseudomonadota bacterium]